MSRRWSDSGPLLVILDLPFLCAQTREMKGTTTGSVSFAFGVSGSNNSYEQRRQMEPDFSCLIADLASIAHLDHFLLLLITDRTIEDAIIEQVQFSH